MLIAIYLNTFWDDVYNFQLKRTKNESTAEDITIESFTKAFEKINTYNDKYIFKTWLITISKNLHIDQIRKSRNNLSLIETNDFKDISKKAPLVQRMILINEQKLRSLKNKISQLKPSYKKVIELKYFNELTYKEISSKLNQPINNVKVRVMRAKRILAEIIEKS